MAVVLQPFRFARDGFTIESLAPGDERDFGSCHDGLVVAGLITDEKPEEMAVDAQVGDSAPNDGTTAEGEPVATPAVEEAKSRKRGRTAK